MNKLFILFLFYAIFSFSQTDIEKLKRDASNLCLKNKRKLFCKSFSFYKEKEYDSCYLYSERALTKVDKFSNEYNLLNYILGFSASKKGLFKKAIHNFNELPDSSYFKSLKLLKLGSIYLLLKDYDKSIEFYNIWEKDKGNSKLSFEKNAYHNFALSYLHKKKYSKAKEYFNKELSLLKQKKDTASTIRTKMELANVYYSQYLDNEAIPLFKEAYNLAKIFPDLKLKQNSAKNMAAVERNRKNYKESVGYYREFIKWKDSISKNDNILELAERDKKMAIAQKQREIAVQDEKLKRQKVVQKGLLFGASGLLVFLGLLGFFYKKLKNQNALITQQKEALNSANKTKNYLFSVVSHDLRSPMNTIKYQHEQLKKHIASNNLVGIKEANNTAITVTESTSHLLNNVLHWSLEQSNQMVFSKKEQPLKPIVEHVLVDYENLIEANDIEITTNYIQNSLVTIDRESIKIVLRNLLDNAIKYRNGKDKITVEVGVYTSNNAFISVQDTGIGISEERLQKINALQSVSIDKINRSEGVGLGLILCQMLVKKNDGSLVFESEEGKGTKVSILLPVFN